MRSRIARGVFVAAIAAIAAVAVLSCTEDATDPAPGSVTDPNGDASVDSNADADASPAAVDATADADAAPPTLPWGSGKTCGSCSAGTKACGLRCVGIDEARFGCGATSCGPDVPLPLFATTSMRCVGGKLALTCVAGFKDCDGDPKNGCEALMDAPENCGACGNACAPGQVCDLGQCKAQCDVPRTNCQQKIDSVTPKGSCRDLSTSNLSCGSCTGYCGDYATTCTNGTCGANVCPAGTHPCGYELRCVADDDPVFCGGCTARELREGEQRAPCNGAEPAVTCLAGYDACPSVCGVDLLGDARCREAGCTATAADRLNCGACGITCAAGQRCVAGACTDTPPEELATNLPGITDLVLDGPDVYVGRATTIERIPKTGGAAVKVVEDARHTRGFALDGTHVYWASELGAAILRAPRAGGDAEVMVAATSPRKVIVDDTSFAFADDAGVYRGPKTKGASVVELHQGKVNAIGQSNSHVLAFTNNRIEMFDKATNAPAASGFNSSYYVQGTFAVAETGLFYVMTYTFVGTGSKAVYFQFWSAADGKSASVPTTKLDGPAPDAMASDGCAVYYALGGVIHRFRPGTPAPERLVSASVLTMAVDDTHVYWTDGTSVRRIAK